MPMMRIAAVGLIVSACGSEPFTPELFTEPAPEDGGSAQPAPEAAAQEASVLDPVEDAGACSAYLSFPGTYGSYAKFAGPDVTATSFAVELRVRIPPGGRMGLVRRGPENPCGWSLYVDEARVMATVTASFDHEVSTRVAGTRWHRLRWELGAESVLLIDGAEVGRRMADQLPKTCSGQTTLGVFGDATGVPYDWSLGDVDSALIGVSRWDFSEPDGALVDESGKFPGSLAGNVARKCD